MTALGDLIAIDDQTVLVRGQELDVEHDQPDVANALVHRVGDTLVLVDTGVTAAFRAAVREAAGRVGPWSRALVLTTHGRTYEERPLERIRIGSPRFTGWTFADGAVRVLRSQGHCAGHVIVHLSDCGILHLSDEGNGPCGAMAGADQLKIQTVLGAVALLFEEGGAALLTDGHTFAVRRGAEVVSYLDGLLDQATALQEAALTLTGESGQVRPGAFTTRYAQAFAGLGSGGANPNTMFTAMMAVNQLRELGLRPESGGVDAPWSRPVLRNPAPPDGPWSVLQEGQLLVGELARAGVLGGRDRGHLEQSHVGVVGVQGPSLFLVRGRDHRAALAERHLLGGPGLLPAPFHEAGENGVELPALLAGILVAGGRRVAGRPDGPARRHPGHHLFPCPLLVGGGPVGRGIGRRDSGLRPLGESGGGDGRVQVGPHGLLAEGARG
ncbi:hypothetical protein [Streptomyces sp. NBC_01294]|uniref:hypothetical protein n=1 Tax=Streptomyces sp. NBC_01294 TaxID=2903815 RepID=UPI002DDA99E0|nr:hypothetical protein [Streptomyces sp. NBC_01294]WRZ61082.1 hypothetical protein OG534_34035 [Streptomyces sp. NBC_01294]